MFDRRQLLASTAALAVAGHAPLALAADKPPIKVGSVLAMTGIGAVYGVLYNAALKMAIDDVNAAGGVNGSPLTLLQEDDQLQPAQSVLCFRKTIADGSVVELGPLTGTSWETIAPIANQMKMPALCFTASKAGISAPPYALRIAPPDDTAIPEGVAEFMKLHPNVKKIAIAGDAAHVNNPLGGMGLNGGIHDAYNLASTLVEIFNGAPMDLLGRYERQRRKVALDVVQQTTLRNRAILNTRSPEARAAYYADLRGTVADPVKHKDYLMRTSMISSLKDVAKIL